jgi:Uncharacterized protein conserved in bacteria
MKYALLIQVDADFYARPKDEQNRVHEACGRWHEEIVRSGRAVSATGLHPRETAKTVRGRGGKSVVTDGPFAETKEVLGGFEIVECRDLEEALELAKGFPGLEAGGAVEVRAIVESGKCEA